MSEARSILRDLLNFNSSENNPRPMQPRGNRLEPMLSKDIQDVNESLLMNLCDELGFGDLYRNTNQHVSKVKLGEKDV